MEQRLVRESAMNGRTRFVIVGTQRTGTTYIRTMLDNHPDVRCIGEAFLKAKKGSEYFHTYVDERNIGFLQRTLHKKRVLNEYLDVIYGQEQFKAIGFKLMLNQSNPLLKRYFDERRVKVIVLVRENILKTLLSRETAKRRNVFHLKGDQRQFEKITLDCEDLVARLDKIEREKEQLRGFTDGEALHVTYEQVLENGQREFRRMLSYIEVDDDRTLHSPLVKINPNSIRDIVSNYEEVEKVLMQSAYGRYLS
jgi:LPS sulfotransferase NodH